MSTATGTELGVETCETITQAQKRMHSRHCNLNSYRMREELRYAFDDRVGTHIGHSWCVSQQDCENYLHKYKAETVLQSFTDAARYLRSIDCTYLSESEVLDTVNAALEIRDRGNSDININRILVERLKRGQKE